MVVNFVSGVIFGSLFLSWLAIIIMFLGYRKVALTRREYIIGTKQSQKFNDWIIAQEKKKLLLKYTLRRMS